MVSDISIPGVHTTENPFLPPSIDSVDSAIPSFIGYTEQAIDKDGKDIMLVPTLINSMLEYERYFGLAPKEKTITVTITENAPNPPSFKATIGSPSVYTMYYGLQVFFNNGGGPCYIVSAGKYGATNKVSVNKLKAGLTAIKTINDITLIVFPDALGITSADDYYSLFKASILLCQQMEDRFTIMDVWINSVPGNDNILQLRNADLGETSELKYAAAYYPQLISSLDYNYTDRNVKVIYNITTSYSLAALKQKNNAWYFQCKNAIQQLGMLQAAAPALAGIYANVDNTRGVWKAPANINIALITSLIHVISDNEQDELNIDPVVGKSINAIRTFPGKGNAIVWGSRTLAGNDNEWRYIPVCRFYIMVKESIMKATSQFVFQPNDANTWVKIKAMIENYLTRQWRSGALMGATTKEAYYVHIGLGQTMTTADILDGLLIVEIGMAMVKPAEFIILRFSQKMTE